MPSFSFEDIKTFAAFGGFLLGAANLAITVYDKFLKRGTIQIEVEKATAKMLGRGWYAVQLDVILKSHRTKNWVKALYLEHSRNVIQVRVKENGAYETTARLPFQIGLLQELDDYLELDQTELIERLKTPPDTAVPLKDLSLDEGEQKSFRLVAELETERLPDETLDLPLHGWRLIVNLGQTKASVLLSFKPHHTSPKVLHPQQSKSGGFIDG